LLRLIIGELSPLQGDVERRCEIGYLPQVFHHERMKTVSDVLGISDKLRALEAIGRGDVGDELFDVVSADWNIPDQARAFLSKFDLAHLSFDRDLATVSGGEVTRLALAGILLKKPQYLLLDEPTNNLDLPSRLRLYEFIKSWTSGCLVVSHDRTLLNLMDSMLELANHSLLSYGGNFEFYRCVREREDIAAQRGLAAAQQQLKKEQAAAQKSRERNARRASVGQRKAASAGQANIILGVWKESSQRTSGRQSRVHEKRIGQARAKREEARNRIRPENILKLQPLNPDLPSGKVVLDVDGLVFAYPGTVGRPLIKDLSLKVVGRERVALAGVNGAGKTTLLRLIVGELAPTCGTVMLGIHELAYIPQSAVSLHSGETVLNAFERLSYIDNPDSARQCLSRSLFYGDAAFKRIDDISGGERIRLALGAVLSRPAAVELLLIDEPTNHLDLDSVEQLESALQDYEGALVVVSHDEIFLEAIGIERILDMSQ
jgi:ATPase subunit of ABC transporter with duplicated ATPase domains